MALDQLFGRALHRFAEVEPDSFNPTREAERKSLAIAGVHRRHRVLSDVQAFESEAPRYLLLDSALADQASVVEQAHDRGSTGRPGRFAFELHAQHRSSARKR